MSRTYKTDPYWVKIKKSKIAKEYHDHSLGECDFDPNPGRKCFYWKTKNNCGYTISYYAYHGGFWARGYASWLHSEIKADNGSARTELRKDVTEMKKLSFDDIKDYDVVNPRHRHSAIWNM